MEVTSGSCPQPLYPPGKEPLVPTELKAGWWALEPVWTIGSRVTTPTTLPQPQKNNVHRKQQMVIGMGGQGLRVVQ
jgi:hypothetical protein